MSACISVLGFVSGAVLGAIVTVLEGARTWREAGADLAELVLIALGVKREEALAISRTPLPEFSSGAAFPP
jgi:predicted nicotinamide N-methyase